MLHRVTFCPDPLSDSLPLQTANRWWFALWFTLSSGVHVSFGLTLPSAQKLPLAPAFKATEVFDIEPPAPPPPEPPPPEPPAAAASSPKAPPAAHRPTRPQPSAQDRPGAAAALLTAHENAGPLDFTDQFVTGQATAYAGGATSSRGSTSPKRGNSYGAAPVGDSGSADGTGPDHSRRASVVGGFAWFCPFPPAADIAGIDLAVVELRIRVDAGGRLAAVSVAVDPGYGFAEAARRCAAGKQFRPALDRNGVPVSSELVVRVRFTR